MPRWDYRVDLGDVFHNDAMSFPAKRDAIVGRIKRSRWYKDAGQGEGIRQLVAALERTRNVAAFDRVWNAVYDQADEDRCWIDVWGKVSA